jgi:hypothetical protein
MGRDELPVAQDDDPVGDAGDLVQAVADLNETDAFRLQTPDLFEKALGLFGAQRGGRLIEDQQARVQRQRLRDLDLLLGGDFEVAHPLLAGPGDADNRSSHLNKYSYMHRLSNYS